MTTDNTLSKLRLPNYLILSDTSVDILINFFNAIPDDPRITATHVSLYAALLYQWSLNHFNNPMQIEREKVMHLSKISGLATYFKCMKNLHEYGYIKYMPAGHRYMKSSVNMKTSILSL